MDIANTLHIFTVTIDLILIISILFNPARNILLRVHMPYKHICKI